MVYGCINVIDNFYRQAQVAILCCPVFFRSRDCRSIHGADGFIPYDLYAFTLQHLEHMGQEICSCILMDQQRFHSIADRRALCLGVDDNSLSHGIVCPGIYKGMAHPDPRFDNRHAGIAHHRLDQTAAATGNHNIHQPVQGDQFLHSLMVCTGNKLDTAGGNTRFFCSRPHDFSDFRIRTDGFAAPLQDRRITAFQAQADSISRNVRPGFIYNANHPKGNPDLRYSQSVRQGTSADNFSYRIPQGSYLPQPLRHIGDPRLGQKQPVNQRSFHILCFPGLDIQGIGSQYRLFFCQ